MGSFLACIVRRVVMVTFLRWGVLEAIGEWEECLHCCRVTARVFEADDGRRAARATRGRAWRDIVMDVF